MNNRKCFECGSGIYHKVRENFSLTTQDGDTLEVTFPKKLRFERIDPQTPDRAALMSGPLLYVALSDNDLTLHGDQKHPESWIVPGAHGELLTREGVAFLPLYLVHDQHYTTYPKISPKP